MYEQVDHWDYYQMVQRECSTREIKKVNIEYELLPTLDRKLQINLCVNMTWKFCVELLIQDKSCEEENMFLGTHIECKHFMFHVQVHNVMFSGTT